MQTQVRGRDEGIDPKAIARARVALIPDDELTNLAETFSALADSNRMKILFALATTELCVLDLATVVGVTESAVSQHLRILNRNYPYQTAWAQVTHHPRREPS